MVCMSAFARTQFESKYAHTVGGRKETWEEMSERVVNNVVLPYLPDLAPRILRLILERKFVPGGRYLYCAGRPFQQLNNCFLFRAHDSREGWGDIAYRASQSLMTGGGIGIDYSDLRYEGAYIKRMGGLSTGPIALMKIINEMGRYTRQGGSRRSAIWAGLNWKHKDIFKFIGVKEWDEITRMGKREDFNFPAPMDSTNVSVLLDDEFFTAYHDETDPDHDLAHNVFWCAVRSMLRTGEPGFSIDIGENAGETLRNACTEVCSSDDGDCCNLGSLVMSRFSSPEEFEEGVDLGSAFLICGTLASQLPVPYMHHVREKNRRLGVGLMGVHEWLLKRGRRYGPDAEMGHWLEGYRRSGSHAFRWADRLGLSRPVATRSIAPTGTISIVSETTSGCEPVFAVAYQRRYRDGETWKYQYVIDPAAKRMVDEGVDPDLIEDALSLAEDVGRRMSMQAWLQTYVDHGISSTINLPPWGTELNSETNVTQFGKTLLKYLPGLRGITAYPDGSRDGQPLTRVPYREAIGKEGLVFMDAGEGGCQGGVCGA